MNKLKVESEKLKGRKAAHVFSFMKCAVFVFIASLLLASCSKAYKPIGVKKHKKKNCDCSRWSYNDINTSPAGTSGGGDADLYVLDVV
ncbi:MAG: hypothetical protein MJZ78_07550 [Bacteroidales bacterium]|nr:hypothetical protein [Bacteroidales bacterium]